MLTATQDDTYFQRMASSLGDKARLLYYLEPGPVLDLGAGGGELAAAISETHETYALDGSAVAIKRIRAAYPTVKPLQGYAHEITELVGPDFFQSVVASSLFHEVYSYGIPETGPYSMEALVLTLKRVHSSLKPGGRLVIRDGIMPSNWNKPVLLQLNEDGENFLSVYRQRAPFASWAGEGQRCVKIKEAGAGLYSTNLAGAMEFLYTYTWGWESMERESKELYGVLTVEQYCSLLEEIGFTVEEHGQYLQPGYAQHLLPLVKLTDADGQREPLPASNCTLVARKQS